MSDLLPRVQADSEISLAFKMELLGGSLVEEAPEDAPLRFQLGQGEFLDKLEALLVGLELGTTAKLTIGPEGAFGFSDPQNIHSMDLADFPLDMPPQKGQVIGFSTPTGQEVPGTIKAVNDGRVLVDFNHPLADATVLFTAKIIEIHS
ncbi:FKBP-type peptidyl-prolyl cis-trans isomerase [Thiosulfatimonas sediminis]|nr:FKBP-type peptidyl-prolyl cis-trans isomerase [Thiosulfatimonas sediminis]